jgi:hypothetical protein
MTGSQAVDSRGPRAPTDASRAAQDWSTRTSRTTDPTVARDWPMRGPLTAGRRRRADPRTNSWRPAPREVPGCGTQPPAAPPPGGQTTRRQASRRWARQPEERQVPAGEGRTGRHARHARHAPGPVRPGKGPVPEDLPMTGSQAVDSRGPRAPRGASRTGQGSPTTESRTADPPVRGPPMAGHRTWAEPQPPAAPPPGGRCGRVARRAASRRRARRAGGCRDPAAQDPAAQGWAAQDPAAQGWAGRGWAGRGVRPGPGSARSRTPPDALTARSPTTGSRAVDSPGTRSPSSGTPVARSRAELSRRAQDRAVRSSPATEESWATGRPMTRGSALRDRLTLGPGTAGHPGRGMPGRPAAPGVETAAWPRCAARRAGRPAIAGRPVRRWTRRGAARAWPPEHPLQARPEDAGGFAAPGEDRPGWRRHRHPGQGRDRGQSAACPQSPRRPPNAGRCSRRSRRPHRAPHSAPANARSADGPTDGPAARPAYRPPWRR